MSLTAIVNPYQPLVGLTGIGVNAGSLYIGIDGQDPETFPQACFWDAAGATPATQPIQVLGGYPMRLGTPAQVFTAPTYSMRLRDVTGTQVFYVASAAAGTGGTSASAFNSRTAAAAANISSGPAYINVAGYAAAGDGGVATYVRSTSTTQPGSFQSADGAWWKYVPDARGVNARAFGATSDAHTSASANRQGIQDAIDFAIYVAKAQKVYIPGGQYTVNDWLHLGYGDVFHSCRLEGDGAPFVNNGSFSGTCLTFTALDRPGLCISASRIAGVDAMGLFGQNQAWIIANALCGYDTPPLVDDLVLANWFSPALTNPNTQFTPYAGIVIDAFVGARPATHYPTVTYPAWTGISSQYNKNPSFETELGSLNIIGWGYALAIQPGNFNGNGDFVHLRHVLASYCAGIVTAGNNQGRSLDVDNCGFAVFHTAYLNYVHGQQQGQFDLNSRQSDYGAAIQIMDVTINVGPCKFSGGYCEGLYRFGNFGTTNADGNPPLSIESMVFTLDSIENDFRGYPVTWLMPGAPTAVEIANCTFTGYKGLLPLGGYAQSYFWRNNRAYNRDQGAALTQTYQQIAHDATAGGVCFMPTGNLVARPREFVGSFVPVDLSTGTYGGAVNVGLVCRSQRSFPVVVWSQWAEGFNNQGEVQPVQKAWDTAGALASSFSSVTLVNGVLTLVFNTFPDDLAQRSGPLPGDILWHDVSQLLFRVRSRTGLTVIAEITSGYNFVGGTFSHGVNTGGVKTPLVTFNPAAGTIYVCNCRVFRPANYLQADTAVGAVIMTNAGNANGSTFFFASEVVVGDSLWQDATVNNNINRGNAVITAVDATAKTITISAFGALRAETRFPIPYLIRQPPANA